MKCYNSHRIGNNFEKPKMTEKLVIKTDGERSRAIRDYRERDIIYDVVAPMLHKIVFFVVRSRVCVIHAAVDRAIARGKTKPTTNTALYNASTRYARVRSRRHVRLHDQDDGGGGRRDEGGSGERRVYVKN